MKKTPSIPFFAKSIVLMMGLASLSHAITVRYKAVQFKTDFKQAYEWVVQMLPDSTGLVGRLDSMKVGSVCEQQSTQNVVDCYYAGIQYKGMSQQECCLIRTKGMAVAKLEDSLMMMRAMYDDFRTRQAEKKFSESLIVRELNFTASLFFNDAGLFWKYEVAGNPYPASNVEGAYVEADTLMAFMETKYGNPSWIARHNVRFIHPGSEVGYAKWSVQQWDLALVISCEDSLCRAKEVADDRQMAREYEQEEKKQGPVDQTLSATPK